MSKSNYAETEVLKYLLTTEVMGTRPTAWFVSLHTANPGDTGTDEVDINTAYTNYTRQTVTFDIPTEVDVGPSYTQNNNVITFPSLTGTGVNVTHFGIFDADVGGNLLYSGALDFSKNLTAGETLSWNIAQMVIREE